MERPSLMSVVLGKADSRVLTKSNGGCVFIYTTCVSLYETADSLCMSTLVLSGQHLFKVGPYKVK